MAVARTRGPNSTRGPPDINRRAGGSGVGHGGELSREPVAEGRGEAEDRATRAIGPAPPCGGGTSGAAAG
eukprot:12979550-Alexandrium_andersonii.AAC.1